MKKLFVYFDKKEICKTPDEAIKFVSGLTHGKASLIVNDHIIKNINDIFNNDPRFENYHRIELATTNCGPTRILVYDPLAESVEEHDRILSEQEATRKEQQAKANAEYISQRIGELNENKKGWYNVNIIFERVKFHQKYGSKFVESTYSGDIVAESGMDAYNKVYAYLSKEHQIWKFPESTSHDYCFLFLGVKTDDGYSEKLWEEWKKEGII